MSTPADAVMTTQFTPARRFRVNVKLNIRSAAKLSADRVSRAEPGEVLQVEAAVPGDSFHGQSQWYRLLGGQRFVWSGGVAADSAPVAPPPTNTGPMPDVDRRSDGTIKPLSPTGLKDVFGTFLSKPAKKAGFIDIDPTWVNDNTELLVVPALADLGFPKIRVHKKARAHFEAVFTEIDNAGLSDTLLSCGGTFVPRHIGRDVSRPFSSHSWGVAIDLNVDWNGYGQRPALRGQIGSLREIVPIFAAHGFAWGGDFTTPDGMHFELARRDA